MNLKVEINVNAALEDAFLCHLRVMEAGLYLADDRKELEELIAHVVATEPEEWNEYAKSELANFLMLRSGFNTCDGVTFSEWGE